MAKQAIFIMVDTQRTDMVGFGGDNALPTPALEELASEGAVFENAYDCQPVCGPARSAIFTGLYPHANGMIANGLQLGANIKHTGQWLSPHGIRCGYVGKWHLDGGDYFGYGKCPDGFEEEFWYDMRNYMDELPDKERKLSRRNMMLRFDDPDEEDTYAHKCVDKAAAFLERHRDEDFFLALSLDEPHDPSVCPRRFFRLLDEEGFRMSENENVRDDLADKPEHQRVWAKKFRALNYPMVRIYGRPMYACSRFCDYEIGRFLSKVKELGIDPMIIYTADHGEMLLSHGLMGKGPAMYDEIINVPLVIRGGGFEKGRYSTPVSHIDLLPTLLDYFGVKIPACLQGESVLNIEKNVPRDVFIEYGGFEVEQDSFMGYQPIRCIFDGRYKLVINLLTSDEFYDLETDPDEMRNLISTADRKLMKIRNSLHDRLLDRMNETRDVYRGYYWACRPWRRDKKPSFNYTGMARQYVDEDFVRLDYGTGLPTKKTTQKKRTF